VRIAVAREVVTVGEDGTPSVQYEPVDHAGPGDVLRYTVAAHNLGRSPALHARLQDPIPEGTVLLPDSVSTAAARVMASLDGGKNWHEFPAMVEMKDADGVAAKVPAAPDTYTHLQWILPGSIEPGQQREVTFKVRVR
jgi:uncharacterized repeat protein (TIGR01451 family)